MHRITRLATTLPLLVAGLVVWGVAIPSAPGRAADLAAPGGSPVDMGTGAVTGVSVMRMLGSMVRDRRNVDLGVVHDVVIGADGRVHQLVIAVGGGPEAADERLATVPFGMVSFVRDHVVVVDDTGPDFDAQAPLSYPDDDQLHVVATRQPDSALRDPGVPPREFTRYLRETSETMEEWQARVDTRAFELRQEGERAAFDAAQALEQSWATVRLNWARLQNATGAAGEASKADFERAWDDFQTTWDEISGGQ